MTSRHGLENLGNTCYLNSAFQALRKTTPFAEYFGTDAWKAHLHEDRKGVTLAEHTAELVTALQKPGADSVSPRKFVRTFVQFAHEINDEIRPGAQACAAEAIQILLDGLHTQLSREVRMNISGVAITADQTEFIKSLESWSKYYQKEYSPLVDAFYGQTQIKLVCTQCKHFSIRYEPWGVLELEIPGAEKAGNPAPTLHECFIKAFSPEMIDDYTCENCKQKGVTRKETKFSRLPKNLILTLKRFTNTGAKVRARISYDENNVDLAAMRTWPSLQVKTKYHVVSTVEHMGSSRGGHYCMRARDDEGWYVYDDERVSAYRDGGSAGPDTYVLILEQI